MAKSNVLFILKRREDYSVHLHGDSRGLSTGLYNSANYVNQMLINSGIESNLSVVIDNNYIDREVTLYKPTHVIIEALWVVPSKFSELCKLHPKVTWIIRLHSELPFIANEGIAMDWIADYARFKNLIIGVNAPRMIEEIKIYLASVLGLKVRQLTNKVIYLPNFYKQEFKNKKFEIKNNTINIGCFGAVRPLKNHLVQAIAALKFAEDKVVKLNFHINGNRLEMKGEPVLHNLKGMFEQLSDRGHQLILNDWTDHDQFLELCSNMDIGMQVSFSETFNIVCADLISQGVPIIGSTEIPWADRLYCADPTNSNDIVKKLKLTLFWPNLNVWRNAEFLLNYTNKTRKIWIKYFGDRLF